MVDLETGWSPQDRGRVILLGLKLRDDPIGCSGNVGENNNDTGRWAVIIDDGERVWVKASSRPHWVVHLC